MLTLTHRGTRLCDGVSRRQWLSAGALAGLGLSLPGLIASRALAADGTRSVPATSGPAPRAKSCILMFLWGGPGAQETWDLKPDAPAECRGEFRPIATAVPGTQVCEHLPELALRADRYALVRSLTHTGVNHGTSAYHMLTGHIHRSPGTLRHPERRDVPNLAVNAARFLQHPRHLPGCVHLPSIVNDGDGLPVPGQEPGFLGEGEAPFRVLADLTASDFRLPELALAPGVDANRLARRGDLRRLIETRLAALEEDELARAAEDSHRRAIELLSSPAAEAAFALAREPEAVRERYGRHHFGQGLLLARRLVEAGVPLVTVFWNSPSNTDDQSWDTHTDQHRRMREHLLPAFDRAASALLDDMAERGLLDETLLAWYGEFGRTPRINGGGGRDHWGFCQSIGLAGAGIRPGVVHGASTPDGGYAARDAASPDDLAATILAQLGIDHRQHMHDLDGRPLPLSYGEPIAGVLA
jgi:hypothetical protein